MKSLSEYEIKFRVIMYVNAQNWIFMPRVSIQLIRFAKVSVCQSDYTGHQCDDDIAETTRVTCYVAVTATLTLSLKVFDHATRAYDAQLLCAFESTPGPRISGS